jgi:hypothetical protein
MKFAIFREAVLFDGKKKRKFLVEWNEKQIFDALYNKVLQNVGQNGAEGFKYAWEQTLEDFKKESIKIP